MIMVTCRTAGCSESGITKQADNSPDPEGVIPSVFACGVCGREITDVAPNTDPAPVGQ